MSSVYFGCFFEVFSRGFCLFLFGGGAFFSYLLLLFVCFVCFLFLGDRYIEICFSPPHNISSVLRQEKSSNSQYFPYHLIPIAFGWHSQAPHTHVPRPEQLFVEPGLKINNKYSYNIYIISSLIKMSIFFSRNHKTLLLQFWS